MKTLAKSFMQALVSSVQLSAQLDFCPYFQINLNGCVERWCRRVLLTQCEAVGAKLIITNGEEYGQVSRTRNIACCVACFPVWLLRNGIYKVGCIIRSSEFYPFRFV